MRKWFTWCLLTAVAFVGSGCSDDDDGGQVKLAFSKRTAVFGAGGGAVSINVDAAGAWSAAQPEAGWLEVEYDATSMRLHAEANPSPEVRQAEVVVTTGDYTATIDVAQEPAAPVTLDVKGPESYVVDSEGGELLLSVASLQELLIVRALDQAGIHGQVVGMVCISLLHIWTLRILKILKIGKISETVVRGSDGCFATVAK